MKYIKKVSASYQGDTPIATSITSSSTNNEVAGAKAVYDFAQTEDITSQVTFTPESGVTESGRTVYKRGSIITLILTCNYNTRSASIFSLGTLSLTPMYQSYGVGTSYDNSAGTFGAFGRINTSGVVTAITTGTSYQVTFNIDFPLATTNRSLNLMRGENTGSLVGMGDRAELTSLATELTDNNVGNTEQVEKQVEQVKEQVKNISAEPIEIKTEGSGDSKWIT